MRRPFLAVAVSLLALALAGCSNKYESATLGLEYKPPSGVKLLSEEAGPPALATFSGGIELRSVPGAPPAVDEARLDALFDEVRARGKLAPSGPPRSAKPGTIAAGKVVRFELKEGATRSLVYFLPLESRFVLVSLSAPEDRYGMLEAQLERSLSSLSPR